MAIRIRTGWIVFAVIFTLIFTFQISAFAASIDDQLGADEVKMGSEAAAEIAKNNKFSDNAADLKRVRDIGAKIAEVANKKVVDSTYGNSKVTPFQYAFDIIEEKDVNAFCIPGGHIYIYRGLLDFVQSDQELAGVIAHEITHASHHHMVYLLKKQASMQNAMAIAMLAMILGGSKNGSDLENISMGIQLYEIARLNGYGMQAERDSDHGAIIYTKEAGYNPVGLLTFLERLAQRPEFVNWGIYQSHPLDADRVRATKDQITQMGLPINRRATTKAILAEVKTEKVQGADTPEVVIQGVVIYRPAPQNGKTAAQRAQETADAINKALDTNLKIHELKVDASGGVTAKDKVLLVVSDEDAMLMSKTPAQVANIAAAAIRDVVWKQMVDTLH